jgi:SH3-like domain-containing protein
MQLLNLITKLDKIFLLFLIPFFAEAEEIKLGPVTGLPLPRLVVLKSKKVNMRSGPGIDSPIKITYKCPHLPVEILGEFDNWRLIRDRAGNNGWIHEAMLTKKPYSQIIFQEKEKDYLLIYRLPNPKSQVIAKIQEGTLIQVLQCDADWCKVSFGKKGWLLKKNLWGLLAE